MMTTATTIMTNHKSRCKNIISSPVSHALKQSQVNSYADLPEYSLDNHAFDFCPQCPGVDLALMQIRPQRLQRPSK